MFRIIDFFGIDITVDSVPSEHEHREPERESFSPGGSGALFDVSSLHVVEKTNAGTERVEDKLTHPKLSASMEMFHSIPLAAWSEPSGAFAY